MTTDARSRLLRDLLLRSDHIDDAGLRRDVERAVLDVSIGFGHREYIRGAGRTWWSVATTVALWTWLYAGGRAHWWWGVLFALGVAAELYAIVASRLGDALLDQLDRTVAEHTTCAAAMRHEQRAEGAW